MRAQLGFLMVTALALFALPASADEPARTGSPPSDEAPSSATAEQREEARVRFSRGVQLYEEEEYKLALIEFERAYAMVPNWRILYNIGQVCTQLGQYARAVAALERYLAEGGKRIPPERVAEVQRDLATVRARTAKLQVVVKEPGADIAFDDAPLAKSPMTTANLVDAGEHRVTVSKPGFKTERKPIVLAGGDNVKIDVQLLPEPVAHRDSGEPRPAPNRTPVWIAWGATAGLGVAAGAFGLLALGKDSDREQLRTTRGSSPAAIEDAASSSKTLALTADILGVAAIAAAGVATYLTFRKTDASPRPTTARPAVGGFELAF